MLALRLVASRGSGALLSPAADRGRRAVTARRQRGEEEEATRWCRRYGRTRTLPARAWPGALRLPARYGHRGATRRRRRRSGEGARSGARRVSPPGQPPFLRRLSLLPCLQDFSSGPGRRRSPARPLSSTPPLGARALPSPAGGVRPAPPRRRGSAPRFVVAPEFERAGSWPARSARMRLERNNRNRALTARQH